MRYLGIDYGMKKIGLSLSDESGMLAFPEAVIENGADAVSHIAALANEKGVGKVVVGESTTMSGEPTPLQAKIESFVGALARAGLSVSLEREYLTSREAQRSSDAAHEDAAAAALILQRYLDKQTHD